MAHEDFQTIYNAKFSSGGALQNDIIPQHVDQIIILLDSCSHDSQALIPLRNKLRSIFIIYKKGFQKADKVKQMFLKADQLIEDWKKEPAGYPTTLYELLLELAEEIFFQWNSSGAGILFHAYDANRKSKLRDAIIGKTS